MAYGLSEVRNWNYFSFIVIQRCKHISYKTLKKNVLVFTFNGKMSHIEVKKCPYVQYCTCLYSAVMYETKLFCQHENFLNVGRIRINVDMTLSWCLNSQLHTYCSM
jgi:hypothetical protein